MKKIMSNFKFEFGRPRIRKYSNEEILDELERVAKHFSYNHFCRKDFAKTANIHSRTVERRYGGSWTTAMQVLKERLKRKNIILPPSRRRNIPEKTMFDEMERIWKQLGHRPSRNEWVAAQPKISYDSLYRRFGGWTNACLKFIEYKSGGAAAAEKEQQSKELKTQPVSTKNRENGPRRLKVVGKTRTVPLNLRIRVLNRDNFRCAFCGKSPATDIGTKLHIDHIVPFANGGENTLKNLQTLCEECNLGKSNVEIGKELTGKIR